MKKRFALLLALVMVLSLAACGGGDDKTPSSAEDKTPASSQQQETPSSDVSQPDNKDNETTAPDTQQSGEEEQADKPVPTSGLPLDWPDNDYTKLVPAPDCGGKVLTSGEIGELFAIELKCLPVHQGCSHRLGRNQVSGSRTGRLYHHRSPCQGNQRLVRRLYSRRKRSCH